MILNRDASGGQISKFVLDTAGFEKGEGTVHYWTDAYHSVDLSDVQINSTMAVSSLPTVIVWTDVKARIDIEMEDSGTFKVAVYENKDGGYDIGRT